MTSIQFTKQTLIELASIANNEISLNKMLQAEIAQKKNMLEMNKTLFSHITKNSLLSQIQTELLSYNKSILQSNQRIISQNVQLRNKIKKLKSDYFTANAPILSELEKTKEDNFILSNTLLEKDSAITRLSGAYESITRFAVFQEPKRDLFIKNTKTGDLWFDDYLSGIQKFLLLHLKKFNKWSNRINEKKKIHSSLIKEIRLLKEEKKQSNEKKRRKEILNKRKNDFSHRHNLIPTFTKKDEILNRYSSSENEDEAIIDEELHSDEDMNFEPKIKQKNSISSTYNNVLRKKVPIINLKQIEYNKEKYKEIDLYSLERRDNKESLRSKINEVNSKIKDIKKKIKKNKIKFEKFDDFILKFKRHLALLRHLSTKSSFNAPSYAFEEDEKYINSLTTHDTKEQDYAYGVVNTVTVNNKNKLRFVEEVTELKSV